jgi:hypothetical protein
MSGFEKHRFEIWNNLQHPYKHTLSDFAYSNPAFPFVTTLEGVINALIAVNYPNTKEAVATPADLPTGLDTPNVGDETPENLDYRVVLDDGDGKAAGYRWEQREDELAPSWHKIYDMDWGEESILSNFLTKTNDTYVSKFGQMDVDVNGDLLTGDLAGQYIYGGSDANSHLTLYANSGDGTGADTGFVQFGDQVRPLLDDAFDLGEAAKRFKDLRLSGQALFKEVNIIDSVISSSTGEISFDDENLTTTGNINTNELKTESFLELRHITTPANSTAGYNRLYFKSDDKLYKLDSAGVEKLVGLEFTSSSDNRLIKSDGTTGEAIQESGILISDLDEMSGITSASIGGLNLASNVLSSIAANDDINITPNGTGKVVVPNLNLSTSVQNAIYVPNALGDLTARGITIDVANVLSGATQILVDNLDLNGSTLSTTNTNGDLSLLPNGTGNVITKSLIPAVDNTYSLGSISQRFTSLFMNGNIQDGTNTFSISELMKFRDASIGANVGDSIFWDGLKWVASNPDSEVDHGELAGILDDDHTQYVLLAGRTTGQTITGGVDPSENLTLRSTSNATKGNVVFDDTLVPSADNAKDIGTGSLRLKDIYQSGQLIGSRLQNVTTATLPPSSAANIGRQVYNTENKQVMIDNGVEWVIEGSNKYVADIPFNGVEITKDVTVSSRIVDARNCQIQLLNNLKDFDRVYCNLKAIDASTIRIETNLPLPVGSYRLLIFE